MEKFLLLGASRGLGWETYKSLMRRKSDSKFLLVSRKIKTKENQVSGSSFLLEQDFSKLPVELNFFEQVKIFNPSCIVYFAGGGPYDLYQNKQWKDHEWSFNTTFLYPAQLLHQVLKEKHFFTDLKTLIFVGSAVAENKADPRASSYCAAKHALKGLIASINAEQKLDFDLQLFSPGYMQTTLLPLNSAPRREDLAESPLDVAERLIDFIEK
jgi:short-subunit dehydrogenase